MKIIDYFEDAAEIERLVSLGSQRLPDLSDVVASIIDEVRKDGDTALFKFTEKFDDFQLNKQNLTVSSKEIEDSLKKVDEKFFKALKYAQKNIKKFHEKQFEKVNLSWDDEIESGVLVGERVNPIDSVGCYVPGGRASYPSTVLMNCIPAKVAGVARIVVVSPPPISPEVRAACSLVGVDELYCVGGAQAIGALAWGTESIQPVSKIVGPGNKYVMAAKTIVYGKVDIDMPAGPSEIAIIADETANPDFITADLLAQAEHDPDARCILVTTEKNLPGKVDADGKQFTAITVDSIDRAIEVVDGLAPEHLEIMTKNANDVAKKIRNAGAIFVGHYSPVAAGDYASGGNHVLPTTGSARYASPLSVRDFLKTTQMTRIEKEGLENLKETIETLAEAEGLVKHKESISVRFKD
ncbi:MAG: histidinol dehydrogenase [Methanobacteriota archaeon]